MVNQPLHNPVMADEAMSLLLLKNGDKVLDATTGCGGHSWLMLEKITPDGILIGIDRDKSSLEIAGKRLNSKFNHKSYTLIQANFKDIDKVLIGLGIEKIDAALFDLGISSYQLSEAARGFSFDKEGPLDMRMDPSCGIRACDIVNRYTKEGLEDVLRNFGQERHAGRIARFIVERRQKAAITYTGELARIVNDAAGRWYKKQRIHPATRTFQALRIAVNSELDSIDQALCGIIKFMKAGSRLCVISFHSLEDRIVKNRFREFKNDKRAVVLTKKPLTASEAERIDNPRSRSAKLRAIEIKGEND